MITLRYKETETGKFSIYLDIYQKEENDKATRKYEFLRIYVSRDYSKSKRIVAIDVVQISRFTASMRYVFNWCFGDASDFIL